MKQKVEYQVYITMWKVTDPDDESICEISQQDIFFISDSYKEASEVTTNARAHLKEHGFTNAE